MDPTSTQSLRSHPPKKCLQVSNLFSECFNMFEPCFESIHDDPTLFPHGFHMGPMDFSHFGTPKWRSKVAPQGCIPDVWNLSGGFHRFGTDMDRYTVFLCLCFCSSFCPLCSLSFSVCCFWLLFLFLPCVLCLLFSVCSFWFLFLLLLSLLFFLLFLLLYFFFFFFLVADGRVSFPSPVFMGHVCHCERDGTGVIGPEKTTAMFHQVCGSVWRWGTSQSHGC